MQGWTNKKVGDTSYEKGIEKGKIQSVTNMVKIMLKENLDLDTIKTVSGLTTKEIDNIKNNMWKDYKK